jgi:hypothetical protein
MSKSDPDPHQSKTTGAVEAHNEAMKDYHPRAVGDQNGAAEDQNGDVEDTNGAEEAESRAVERLYVNSLKFEEDPDPH